MPLVDHLPTQVVEVEGVVEYSAATEDPSADEVVSLELDGHDGEGEGGLMDGLERGFAAEVSDSLMV